MNIKGIPVFDAVLDSATEGITCISLVDEPAVEVAWQKFQNQKLLTFAVADQERQLLYGVIMRADYPIYRHDEEIGEYYIRYSADTIRMMAEKYLMDGRQNIVDLMHDGKHVEGVQLVQWVIKDSERGIAPAGFDDVSDGSLFAEFHVTDSKIWELCKDGTFQGFSLEGWFSVRPTFHKEKPKSNIMSKFKKIVAALAKVMLAQITTDKGVITWDSDEDLKDGDEIFIVDEEGNRIAAEDGDYLTDEGQTIQVVEGKVSAILDPQADVAPVAEENEAAPEEIPAPAPEEVPAQGDLQAEIEALQARIAELEAEIEALKGENEKLKATPQASPAHDEFKKTAAGTTGDKRLDRLAKILNA